ncbi:MAG: hypothetical protein OEV93_04545 [Candidatus Moranbacteria bacterium]|nr:hypothetical protein [Candidatus Moranbacteria bacterium]
MSKSNRQEKNQSGWVLLGTFGIIAYFICMLSCCDAHAWVEDSRYTYGTVGEWTGVPATDLNSPEVKTRNTGDQEYMILSLLPDPGFAYYEVEVSCLSGDGFYNDAYVIDMDGVPYVRIGSLDHGNLDIYYKQECEVIYSELVPVESETNPEDQDGFTINKKPYRDILPVDPNSAGLSRRAEVFIYDNKGNRTKFKFPWEK